MCADNPDVLGDDDEVTPGDVEVSEEDMDKANEKKREGIALYGSGSYEEAVKMFTEAIKLNPGTNTDSNQ